MVDRFLLILKAKNITASKFADVVGVQRSSVSHILSGRNNPSLDVIQKILKRFPDISSEWLLSGKGPMMVNDKVPDLFDSLIDAEPDIFSQMPLHNEISKPETVKPDKKRTETTVNISSRHFPEVNANETKSEVTKIDADPRESEKPDNLPELLSDSLNNKNNISPLDKRSVNDPTLHEEVPKGIKEYNLFADGKKIDKIVIFYSDRTFSWYSPSES